MHSPDWHSAHAPTTAASDLSASALLSFLYRTGTANLANSVLSIEPRGEDKRGVRQNFAFRWLPIDVCFAIVPIVLTLPSCQLSIHLNIYTVGHQREWTRRLCALAFHPSSAQLCTVQGPERSFYEEQNSNQYAHSSIQLDMIFC